MASVIRKNWEIVTGCERLTEGCDSCPSYWHHKDNNLDYTVTTHLNLLSIPANDKFTKIYSVAHGSDLFHESVSATHLRVIFNEMNKSRHHLFEIVTKRIERAWAVTKDFEWSENIWLGVAVESGEYAWRIDYLKKIPAKFKFISACPMLGPFQKMDLTGINQVSAIKETWKHERPIKDEWVRDLEKQCKEQEVDFNTSEFYLWENK